MKDSRSVSIPETGVSRELQALRARVRSLDARPAQRVAERTTELRRSEAVFRAVSEQMPDALFLVDLDDDPPGRVLLTNDAAARALGYGIDELLGRSILDFEDSATRTKAAARIVRLRKGETLTFEATLVRRDGSLLPLEASVRGIDYGGRRVAVAICRDLTPRRQAEQLAEQHRAELAHVTRLSTMGEMASGLAHELNQPLAAIANYARGCLHRIDRGTISTEEMRRAMDHVATQAQRAAQIIQRLRRFVRKREPRRSSTDLNELVREAIALTEPEMRDREVRSRVSAASDLPLVLADAIQIEQVILNLLRNAIDAMADLPPEQREVCIASGMAGPDAVELTVRDNGPGVSDDELERLFDPFYTTKANGMGMGLTISRTIAQAHGGKLSVTRNDNGRGLTFRLTLPLSRPSEERTH